MPVSCVNNSYYLSGCINYPKSVIGISIITACVSSIFLILGAIGTLASGNLAAISSSAILLSLSIVTIVVFLLCRIKIKKAEKKILEDKVFQERPSEKSFEEKVKERKEAKAKLLMIKAQSTNGEELLSLLKDAISSGSFHLFKCIFDKMIFQNISIDNYRDQADRCVFSMIAFQAGNDTQAVEMLLYLHQKGVTIPKKGISPLFWAVYAKNSKVIPTLIQLGANPNEQDKDSGMTPLHHSVQGKLDCVKALIENGASIEIKDNRKYSPIGFLFQDLVVSDNQLVGQYLVDNCPSNEELESLKEALDDLKKYGWFYKKYQEEFEEGINRDRREEKLAHRPVCLPTDQDYVILGISKSSALNELRKAYKKLALHYHPDRNIAESV